MKQHLKKIIKKFLGLEGQPKQLHKTLLDKLKENGLKVGNNFKMLPECIIDYSHCWHISIGDNVTLAPRVHILAHDASTKTHLNFTKIKNVTIGNNVFIGTSSIIMPGVTIGNDVIIGAGSVVTKDVSDNSVHIGNPAKFVCHTDEYMQKQQLSMNENNTFGEEFTLRENVSSQMKDEMIESIKKNGVAFVI